MSINIGINGFGRIGRYVKRKCAEIDSKVRYREQQEKHSRYLFAFSPIITTLSFTFKTNANLFFS
jgi:lactate dehydrogenase-like 2-hydroxyacid dehydrogenase